MIKLEVSNRVVFLAERRCLKYYRNYGISNEKFHRTKPSKRCTISSQSGDFTHSPSLSLFRHNDNDKHNTQQTASIVPFLTIVYEFRFFEHSSRSGPKRRNFRSRFAGEPRPRASSWNSKSKVPPCRVHRTDGRKDTNIVFFIIFFSIRLRGTN